MPRIKPLRESIKTRITRSRSSVFLPREFSDLGGEDQVLRALRQLVQSGEARRKGARRGGGSPGLHKRSRKAQRGRLGIPPRQAGAAFTLAPRQGRRPLAAGSRLSPGPEARPAGQGAYRPTATLAPLLLAVARQR